MNQADVILLLLSEGTETKSFFFVFSQHHRGSDYHVGTENWKVGRERGKEGEKGSVNSSSPDYDFT